MPSDGDGLVELARDVLETGEVDDSVEPERPPNGDPHEGDPGPRYRRDPRYVLRHPKDSQIVVQKPHIGVEDEPPQDADNGNPEHVRREVYGPEEVPSGKFLVQKECYEQRNDHQQRH